MRNRVVTGAAAAAIAVVAVAGCKSSSSSSFQGVPASGRASIPGAVATQAKTNYAPIIAKCGVGTAAGQLAAAKDLGSKAGRQALWAKCGVPPQNRQAATTKALDAAEHAHLFARGAQGKANREQYATVTLPKIVQEEQA